MSTRQTTRRERANAIRALSMDAVQKANSGHPGAPMGMADIAEVLWNDYLSHNPANPQWINRDRFILSNGHGSMLIYSLLHLSGYDLPMSELQNFRQLHSRTPGHPEFGYTPGVETTTGPLGQGLANGVGMAIAEKTLAAQFNRPDHDIIDHFTYVFAGDGCLMEGVSHEVSSLAGTLGLGKLIVFYDDNGISIDGEVQGWFTDDTTKRFESYGWQVLAVDGHDADQVNQAIKAARADSARPTLIRCKTVIGFGSPGKSGTSGIHGAPLGAEEIEATRKALGWEHAPFEVPEAIQSDWDARERGIQAESEWKERMTRYEEAHPELAVELVRRLKGELPGDFAARADDVIAKFNAAEENLATRKASQNAIAAFNEALPELLGGSADLTGSNLTMWSGSQPVSADKADGNYIYYGVREFGMSAIMNGIALHGGFIPYGGTFLIFMEYARNAVRMGALMKQHVINVYTHDSIGQGEDGPTHQPIEQLSNLRTTPNMAVWRPSDAVETAVAWKHALLRSNGPTSLVFSRQGLPHQARSDEQLKGIERGGYVLEDCDGTPEVIVIATGSEVSISRQAVKTLQQDGVAARLVAMPSVEYFLAQDAEYREQVLPAQVRRRLAVEAGAADYWYKFVGLDGDVIGMTSFGESAPGGVLMKEFGFTPENIVNRAKALLSNG